LASGLSGEAVAQHFQYKAGRKTVSAWETGGAHAVAFPVIFSLQDQRV